ncbi:MAG: hypothetical protein MJH10_05390 [Epibacterium sp.]|nr:hypothetical protein [Epibacterium sp.]NQX72984.1 hypothetical protein [Epibacterium sp.]
MFSLGRLATPLGKLVGADHLREHAIYALLQGQMHDGQLAFAFGNCPPAVRRRDCGDQTAGHRHTHFWTPQPDERFKRG